MVAEIVQARSRSGRPGMRRSIVQAVAPPAVVRRLTVPPHDGARNRPAPCQRRSGWIRHPTRDASAGAIPAGQVIGKRAHASAPSSAVVRERFRVLAASSATCSFAGNLVVALTQRGVDLEAAPPFRWRQSTAVPASHTRAPMPIRRKPSSPQPANILHREDVQPAKMRDDVRFRREQDRQRSAAGINLGVWLESRPLARKLVFVVFLHGDGGFVPLAGWRTNSTVTGS